MTRHAFTAEETLRGVAASKSSRRKLLRDIKKLTGLEITGEALITILKAGTVWVATPIGQMFAGLIAIKLAEKSGIVDSVNAVHFIELMFAGTTIEAIGASNLIPQIGSLGAALK